MKHVTLPGGEKVPALGLGTWRMGERLMDRQREADTVRAALDMGLTLIDTAEMYGEGGAEEVVGRAVAGKRDQAFIVSKVYPHNASRSGAVEACERSLTRLGTDRIDLYLLHWRGRYPLAETVEAFEALKAAGKIRYWGVSNLDVADMDELAGVPNGRNCAADQVYYHAGERGIEYALLPKLQQAGIVTMAYSPLGQGEILQNHTLATVASRHGVSTATIALAFLLRQDQVMVIPKTSRRERLHSILSALEVKLSDEDLAALDHAFPPPNRKKPLATT